jgi:hypothetical protein
MVTAVATAAARGTARALADRLAESLGPGPAAERLWAARRRLDSGEPAVERIDLADAELTLGDLLDLAWSRPAPPPVPARVGDWCGIRGRGRTGLGGAAALCGGLGAAHPLVLESTYTETESGDAGDAVYRPATIAGGGGRRRLALYARTAGEPRPADPARPWFAPFALTEAECGYTPLCSMHRFRGKRAGRSVEYVADRLLENPKRLRVLLSAAVAAARGGSFAAGPGYLCAGLVDATGAPRAGSVARLGATFDVAGQPVSHDELVDRLLLPLEAVSSGVADQPHLADDPGTLVPVLSGPLRALLLAELAAARSPDGMAESLVWRVGGELRPATGNPPSHRLQHLFRYAVRHARVHPTLLITAPTAPFDLLPDKASRLDYALVRELWRQLARTPDERVEQVVGEWYARRGESLSGPYRRRLRADPRTEGGAEPDGADVALFPEILATTCRRACRVVAVLNREARA